MWKRRLYAALFTLAITLAVVTAFVLFSSSRRHFELSEDLTFSFTNADEIIETIHDGLTAHAQSFTITYGDVGNDSKETEALIDELMNAAMYNTNSPTEGDYVRYQYGGYKLRYKKSQIIIIPTYYATVREEQQVDQKIEEILAGLNIPKGASDREKVRAVYDYICSNVSYDYAHEHNSHYHKDSTAYAAVVKNSASCQGYAVAVFRLLKELGMECEVVTGTGIDERGISRFHAWNRVKLDGIYYNIDATWDAGKTDYDYFLLEDEVFINHFEQGK